MFQLFLVVSLPRYHRQRQRQTKITDKNNDFLSCLCCILATISSNMRCRLFLAKRQLSQSGIVSMFCFPKTFSIKIMPSSLEQFWKIICNSLLPDFSPKIQWFLRRPQFETSSLLFNFEILTISLWLGRCCNFYISQKVSFLKLNCSAKIETQNQRNLSL